MDFREYQDNLLYGVLADQQAGRRMRHCQRNIGCWFEDVNRPTRMLALRCASFEIPGQVRSHVWLRPEADSWDFADFLQAAVVLSKGGKHRTG